MLGGNAMDMAEQIRQLIVDLMFGPIRDLLSFVGYLLSLIFSPLNTLY